MSIMEMSFSNSTRLNATVIPSFLPGIADAPDTAGAIEDVTPAEERRHPLRKVASAEGRRPVIAEHAVLFVILSSVYDHKTAVDLLQHQDPRHQMGEREVGELPAHVGAPDQRL